MELSGRFDDRFRITGKLGAGGMGEVYRAHDERLRRDVALKVLPEELARDASRLARFEQEARAAAALNHPNILALHDLGDHEGTPYLVTELLEGESLRGRIEKGPMPVKGAVELAVQLTRGLAAAYDSTARLDSPEPELAAASSTEPGEAPELEPLWWGLHAGVMGALVGGIADHYFFNPDFHHSVTLFWLVVGLATAATEIVRERRANR